MELTYGQLNFKELALCYQGAQVICSWKESSLRVQRIRTATKVLQVMPGLNLPGVGKFS